MTKARSDLLDRFSCAVLVGAGLVSLAIIGLAYVLWTTPSDNSIAVAQPSALPWVLTMFAAFVVMAAFMGTAFRKLVKRLETMHHLAQTDHLTGLANRAALTEMQQSTAVQKALRLGELAVISLDLDDFKDLNDRLGHHSGDIALRGAAERIKQAMRETDTAFRMGGDEFLCVLMDPDAKQGARDVIAALRTAFDVSMNLGGRQTAVTPSIGVAVADPQEPWDSVLQRADATMYLAKRRKPSRQLAAQRYPALVRIDQVKPMETVPE